MLKPPVITFHKGYRTVNLKDLILWVAAERNLPVRVDIAEALDFEAPWNLWLWMVLVSQYTDFVGDTPFTRTEETDIPLPELIEYMGQPTFPKRPQRRELRLNKDTSWVLAYLDLPSRLTLQGCKSIFILHCRHLYEAPDTDSVLTVENGDVVVAHSDLDCLVSFGGAVELYNTRAIHVQARLFNKGEVTVSVRERSRVNFLDCATASVCPESAVGTWVPICLDSNLGALDRVGTISYTDVVDDEAAPIDPLVLRQHPKLTETLLRADPNSLSADLRTLYYGVAEILKPPVTAIQYLDSEADDSPLWEDL